MNDLDHEELPRLIDQAGSPFEQAILAAGRHVPSSDRRRLQVLLAVGVGSSVALGTKASFAMAAGWKKLLAGGAIVASGTVGVVAYQALMEPEAPAPAVEAVQSVQQAEPAPVEAPAVDEAPAPATFDELPTAEETAAASEAPPTARRRIQRRAANQGSAANQGGAAKVVLEASPKDIAGADLQDEIAALDGARAALRDGQPSRALSHLSDYSQRFPRGSLRLEAEALRIQAFAASGNHAEASRRAKRILERSPNSVLASRLRRYVID